MVKDGIEYNLKSPPRFAAFGNRPISQITIDEIRAMTDPVTQREVAIAKLHWDEIHADTDQARQEVARKISDTWRDYLKTHWNNIDFENSLKGDGPSGVKDAYFGAIKNDSRTGTVQSASFKAQYLVRFGFAGAVPVTWLTGRADLIEQMESRKADDAVIDKQWGNRIKAAKEYGEAFKKLVDSPLIDPDKFYSTKNDDKNPHAREEAAKAAVKNITDLAEKMVPPDTFSADEKKDLMLDILQGVFAYAGNKNLRVGSHKAWKNWGRSERDEVEEALAGSGVITKDVGAARSRKARRVAKATAFGVGRVLSTLITETAKQVGK
jgi:hypothetical protein